MVLRFCARRTLDPEAALDLTAETFAQAFRSRGKFRGSTEAEARAWLLTIARRQIARYLERGSLDRRAVERLGIHVPTMETDELEEVERRAGLRGLRIALGAELRRLPADQREAVRLRVVEERRYDEIAAELGLKEATVRARVSRALRTLAAAFDDDEEAAWTSS